MHKTPSQVSTLALHMLGYLCYPHERSHQNKEQRAICGFTVKSVIAANCGNSMPPVKYGQ